MNLVVIPAYNRRNSLREALYSLCAQTKKNFRVLVVDDCSTEDLKSVIEEFDGRLLLEYVRLPENRGPGHCRNYGIFYGKTKDCKGVIFLDSDDALTPNAVATLSKELGRNGAQIVATDIINEGNNNNFGRIKAPKSLTWVHGKIYDIDYLIKNQIFFPENIRYNEDVDFNTRAFGLTQKISFIDAVACVWRNESGSVTRTKTYAFHEKYGVEAIIAHAQSILFVMEKVESPLQQLADVVSAIFSLYNLCTYYKKNLTKVDELLTKLFTNEKYVRLLTQKKLEKLISNLSLYFEIEGKFVKTMDFVKWFKRFNPTLLEDRGVKFYE